MQSDLLSVARFQISRAIWIKKVVAGNKHILAHNDFQFESNIACGQFQKICLSGTFTAANLKIYTVRISCFRRNKIKVVCRFNNTAIWQVELNFPIVRIGYQIEGRSNLGFVTAPRFQRVCYLAMGN